MGAVSRILGVNMSAIVVAASALAGESGTQPPQVVEQVPEPGETIEWADDSGLETVVTGTRTARPLARTPVPTELITRSELEAFGEQGLDGVMRELPGVELEPSFNAIGLRLQGLDPSY
ncbi:MAG: hypothetical protein AAFQ82_22815, partial [Myxococcota bacterium]